MDEQSLKKLREWFKKNAAQLPWRPVDLDALRDPYAVWISETMLQQTQVSTVRDYFTRWMKRFPDVTVLAAASEEEVFKYWQGLGYYSRARNILKAARTIANSQGGCHNPCKGSRNDMRDERNRTASEFYCRADAVMHLCNDTTVTFLFSEQQQCRKPGAFPSENQPWTVCLHHTCTSHRS